MEWLKAAVISTCAGALIGAVLAASSLPSPAPKNYLGVVAGAFTLCGMFLGHYFVSHQFSFTALLP